MPNLTRTSALAAIAGAASLTLAGFGANAALADTSPTPRPSVSSSTTEEATQGDTPADRPGRVSGPGHGGLTRGGGASELASALSLDEATVRAALEKVREATKPSERPDADTQPTEADREARRTAYILAVAEELGVTPGDVTTAIEQLQSVRQTEHRKEMSDRLDAAVSDGKLTEADKEAVLKALAAGVLGGGPR